ncbi:hypothetical protein DITRI_Ditri02bG0017800 [Diplodiscus trichospermus]
MMTALYKSKTLLVFFISIFGLVRFVTCQSPIYNAHYCFGIYNDTIASYNDTTASFKSNLTTLLESLSSKASDHSFYADRLNRVHSLFLCRGDVSSHICQVCVKNATRTLIEICPSDERAVIWYDQCLLEYSSFNFFGLVRVTPGLLLWNIQNHTSIEEGNIGTLRFFNTLVDEATNASMFEAREMTEGNGSEHRYGLVQCSKDLVASLCSSCLKQLLDQADRYRNNRRGLRILAPSCIIRYEAYPFFEQPSAPLGSPPENEGSNQGESKWIPIAASLSEIFGLALLCPVAVFFWRRRNFQSESGVRLKEFPSIQLNILQAATEQFCDKNKLGEGGFGPVYKGKLVDGKEIVVKRLSRTSGQGLLEFKNEVMLIARLQHKNLVRLLGCCLEQNEKLLVYEYMPNKSLDVFLFDSSIGVQLGWQKRLGIINGIARGILYLHKDSRLRIIHRDLKASNVLLDHEMNPKIDFGMARIFGGNQNEANTNRVVGTYGYMAPEYVMEGLFSIKSDVFSFGVLLLEIISDKRNNGFHFSERGESLLTFAWKLWSKGRGMELIESRVDKSFVAVDILRCIHIGLLCVQEDPADRPTISSVLVMLGSETITLPQPSEPAFSIGRVVVEPTQFTPNDGLCSFNEVSVSNVSPR